MKVLPIVCVLLAGRALAGEGEAVPSPDGPGPLTRAAAVARALAASPALRAAAGHVRVHAALATQAGAFPNPELRGEVENAGGSGSRRGLEDAESTVRVVQRIELGGERAARMRVADGERRRAEWDYEAVRLGVVADVTRAFVGVLAAQERVRLAGEMERLATETARAVERSVAAGAAAPVDAIRATVAAARAGVECARAARALEGARVLLAATWGGPGDAGSRAEGDLSTLVPPSPESELLAALERNPVIERWRTERVVRDATVVLERAPRAPDVTIGAGGRHFGDNGDGALVFELSVPLPLFDRNRGGIAAAEERLAQAQDEADAARASLQGSLREAYLRLTEAHATATAFLVHVLPGARRSADAALDAFRNGAVRPIDVLDARRALVEAEIERLAALERFHVAAAEIERLTGVPLPVTTKGGDR